MSYTTDGENGETCLTKSSGPLPFKRCTQVSGISLAVGSLFKFRIGGDLDIGTFFVDQLPQYGSMLMLAIKRRDTWSTAADFSSHVFGVNSGPQVALVDSYLGSARSLLEVRDVPTGLEHVQKTSAREQEVHFGTVVDINPGSYEWRLLDPTAPKRHAEKASVEFKAAGRMQYTLLRVGAEAVGGQSFPEELIVWPRDGAEMHRGFSDASGKGLFGIPKDMTARHSHAAKQIPSGVSLLVATMFAWVSMRM